MGEEMPKQKTEKLKGHQPLTYLGTRTSTGKLSFRDHQGQLRVPEFEVLDHPTNIEAFTEYERSFGRGKAYFVTHASNMRPDLRMREIAEWYGISEQEITEVQADYIPLAQKVNYVLASEDEETVRDFIDSILEFRRKYPWLYDDVYEKKRFVIKGVSDT